jgi:hypothetical protein
MADELKSKPVPEKPKAESAPPVAPTASNTPVETVTVFRLHPSPRDGVFLVRAAGTYDARPLDATLVPPSASGSGYAHSFEVPKELYDSLVNLKGN